MTGMLLALLAVVFAGIGARDQATVAAMAEAQGARLGIVFVSVLSACLSAAAAAWLAATFAFPLNAKSRLVLVALALGLAGIESLLLTPGKKPQEPTRSLGALFIVLLAHQLTDAARFLIFVIAVATVAHIPAGIGGAIGSMAVLAVAWVAPEFSSDPILGLARKAAGGFMLILALYMAFKVMG